MDDRDRSHDPAEIAKPQMSRRGAQAPSPTPLYERLPHGPHGLGPEAVAANQRTGCTAR